MGLLKPDMRITTLLASIVLIALSLFSCVSPEGEGFTIYLLADDTPVSEIPTMSHLELAKEPIISIADIVWYSRSTHEIELTPDAYQRIVTLEVPVGGKAFAVCVDGHHIYWGAFWTPISSTSFDGVTIELPIRPEPHIIRLQLGYPESPELFRGEDLRGDREIVESLEQAGKLR